MLHFLCSVYFIVASNFSVTVFFFQNFIFAMLVRYSSIEMTCTVMQYRFCKRVTTTPQENTVHCSPLHVLPQL